MLSYSPFPHVFCGPHPLRPVSEMFDALIQEGVTCFIDLTEPGELPDYQPSETTNQPFLYHRFPIPDFSTPSLSYMTNILNALDAALAAGQTVYLHCHGGRGRTGTVVGCWLVRQGLTGAQAIDRIAALRGDHDSPETEEQRAFVLAWGEYIR